MMKTYKYKPLLLTFLFATQYIYGAQLPNVLERWEKALETCNILEIESLTSDPNIDIDVNKGIGSAQKSPLEIVIEGDSPEAPEAVQLLVKEGANGPQEGIDSLILAVLNKVSCNDCKNQVRFELLTWGFLRRQKNICLPGSLYCLIHQFRITMDDDH